MSDRLSDLMDEVLAFRDARDWAQFHTPRNLAAALSIEAAELQETMLWKTDEELRLALEHGDARKRVRQEIGDVLIYGLLLCSALGADPAEAIRDKLALNAQKYPIEKARGSAENRVSHAFRRLK
jgi:dCTP diphosphatase